MGAWDVPVFYHYKQGCNPYTNVVFHACELWVYYTMLVMHQGGFPGGSDAKESDCISREPSSILGLGRYPGGDPQEKEM